MSSLFPGIAIISIIDLRSLSLHNRSQEVIEEETTKTVKWFCFYFRIHTYYLEQ